MEKVVCLGILLFLEKFGCLLEERKNYSRFFDLDLSLVTL
jgi:hypothetical protein